MPVEAEAADHQPVEVAHQEVGDVERARLFVGKRGERRSAGEELVAMRAGHALDAFLREHRVELAAGAAVAVRDEDRRVAIAVGVDLLAAPPPVIRSGRVVQLGRQALHVEVRPAIPALQRDDFAGERAAGDDQRGGVHCP